MYNPGYQFHHREIDLTCSLASQHIAAVLFSNALILVIYLLTSIDTLDCENIKQKSSKTRSKFQSRDAIFRCCLPPHSKKQKTKPKDKTKASKDKKAKFPKVKNPKSKDGRKDN
jgi:hypothetical protein